MSKNDRYKSSIGFTDLLFNLVIGFVFLFMMAFILINPIAKKSDAPRKAEYLVIIEWDSADDDDIDLWLRDPNKQVCSFISKTSGVMHLEKDDLGFKNDKIFINGKETQVEMNREVIVLRGIVPGEYNTAFHVYNRHPSSKNTIGTVKLSIVKINPYKEVYYSQHEYRYKGQEVTLVNFTIDQKGKFKDTNLLEKRFIVDPRHTRGW